MGLDSGNGTLGQIEIRNKVPLFITAEQADLARNFGLEVTGDPAIERAWDSTQKYANTDMVTTFRGPSGAGKEPFARAVHRLRENGNQHPFIAVNCAGLNSGIVESELFGHVKGAFTGASQDRLGAFEQANGGTVLLDEIGDMPLDQQSKLLRVLEDGKITRAGENKTREVDVKVVCATNKPLEELVRMGMFRADLRHRILASQIVLPSWADRAEEHRRRVIEYLLAHLKKPKKHTADPTLDKEALEFILHERFDGNVRDVKYTLERAYALAAQPGAPSVKLTRINVQEAMQVPLPEGDTGYWQYGDVQIGPLSTADQLTQRFIVDAHLTTNIDQVRLYMLYVLSARAMQQAGGNIGRAAELMNVSRRSMSEYLRGYALMTNKNLSAVKKDIKNAATSSANVVGDVLP